MKDTAPDDSKHLLDVYKANRGKWEALSANVVSHVAGHLRDVNLKFTSKSRIKSLESLYAKKAGHYKDRLIRDLIGIRFIVPFLDDVETVVSTIKKLYTVVEVERKSEGLTYREFAYDSVHLEISLEQHEVVVPEECVSCCEIQVRTTLQDAWAEVEHEILFKSSVAFPDDHSIRKKMAALNASLSLSDMIFQEIRDKQKELELWGQSRFKELHKRAEHIDPALVQDDLEQLLTEVNSDRNTKDAVEPAFHEALTAHNEGDYRRAVEYYSKAISAEPELNIRAMIYNHRGLAFFMLGQEQLALADFGQSCNCDPGYYQALNNKALVLRRMGLIEETLKTFTLSLQIREDQPDVYYLRAQTLVEIQEYAKGKSDARRALELDPDHDAARDLLDHIPATGV
ncbi:MAG: hypothetical protein R3F50_01615 [Gammaproteobacteria bacterium]